MAKKILSALLSRDSDRDGTLRAPFFRGSEAAGIERKVETDGVCGAAACQAGAIQPNAGTPTR